MFACTHGAWCVRVGACAGEGGGGAAAGGAAARGGAGEAGGWVRGWAGAGYGGLVLHSFLCARRRHVILLSCQGGKGPGLREELPGWVGGCCLRLPSPIRASYSPSNAPPWPEPSLRLPLPSWLHRTACAGGVGGAAAACARQVRGPRGRRQRQAGVQVRGTGERGSAVHGAAAPG